jgi:hypothetical protein
MEKDDIKMKILHLEGVLVGWQEALSELRNSDLMRESIYAGKGENAKEIKKAIEGLHVRAEFVEVAFEAKIEALEDQIRQLRLELEKLLKEKKHSILEKDLKTPKYFGFDRLKLQALLRESNPNRNRDFSRREIAQILKSNNDLRAEGFPYSLRVLRVVFALGLNLDDIREEFIKVEATILDYSEKFGDETKWDELLETKKIRAFGRALQQLLVTEIGNKNPRYSLEKLSKSGFDNTTFHTFVMEHKQNGVVSALQKFRTLFEVECNIRKHIPDFEFEESGVIKYELPPNI